MASTELGGMWDVRCGSAAGQEGSTGGSGNSEIKGTARWGEGGQLSALGNALAQGYDWFRKTEDSPCMGSGLHRGANISCEPTAASE